MKWIWIGCFIVILLLVLILLTKLKVSYQVFSSQDNDSFKIQLKAWFGLIKYTFDVPLIKVDENSPSIVVEEETKTGKEENMNMRREVNFLPKIIIEWFKRYGEIIEACCFFASNYSPLFEKGKYQSSRMADSNWSWRCCFNGDVNRGCYGLIKGSIIGMISHYFKLRK